MTTELVIFCDGCRRKIGPMSQDEMDFLLSCHEDGSPVLCFDCDPQEADKVPSLFDGLVNNNRIMLGDEWFVFWNNELQRLNLLDYSRVHMRARVRACLSSYTYLNNRVLNSPIEREYVLIDAGCPECGVDYMFENELYIECDNCKRVEVKGENIILPAWVVASEDDNPFDNGEVAFCDDCLELRILKDGTYCPYHHALLTGQYEDGSLGWYNA